MMSIIGGVVGPNWMAWAIQHTQDGTSVGTGMLSVAYVVAAGMILVVLRRRVMRPVEQERHDGSEWREVHIWR